MSSKRIEWIDYLKGLAIILVVLGHSGVPMSINIYILSFHMPLFFIISGMLYNDEKYKKYSIKGFMAKKFKELIIPYLWFSLIGLIISILVNIVFSREFNILYSILSIITVLNINNTNTIELVLWFLPCIYVVEVIFFLISKNKFIFNNLKLILIVFFVVAFIESSILNHIIPFTIDIALTGVIYYGIGFLLKNSINKYVKIINNSNLIFVSILLISSIISIISVKYNSGVLYMYINEYGNYIISFIGALSGSIFLLTLSVRSYKFKIIMFLGKNTLLIFVLHLKIVFITNRVISKIINGGFLVETFSSILNAFLVLLILIPVIKIINSKFQFLVGKNIINQQ